MWQSGLWVRRPRLSACQMEQAEHVDLDGWLQCGDQPTVACDSSPATNDRGRVRTPYEGHLAVLQHLGL